MLFAAKLTIYWHAWCQRVPANQQDFDTAPMRITPGHRSDNATKCLVVYPSIEPRLADHSAPAGTYYSFCESSVSGRVGSIAASQHYTSERLVSGVKRPLTVKNTCMLQSLSSGRDGVVTISDDGVVTLSRTASGYKREASSNRAQSRAAIFYCLKE